MKTYRLCYWIDTSTDEMTWRIFKHTGLLMDPEAYCIYRDTCEKTARAVLRDLERQK